MEENWSYIRQEYEVIRETMKTEDGQDSRKERGVVVKGRGVQLENTRKQGRRGIKK